MTVEELQQLIRDVPDFPKPGIVFKDITPLLAHPEGFSRTVELLAERVQNYEPEGIIAIESRGFIFGTALALRLDKPLLLVRKRGKLPYDTVGQSYDLEYGTDHIEIHSDSVRPDGRYAIVDDLIATGGTAAATAELIEKQGAEIVCFGFVIELDFLNGRKLLGDRAIETLIHF